MTSKNKMPPELLEHFKSKSEGKEERKETDKEKRKEAVHKARVRLESRNRKRSNDGKKESD